MVCPVLPLSHCFNGFVLVSSRPVSTRITMYVPRIYGSLLFFLMSSNASQPVFANHPHLCFCNSPDLYVLLNVPPHSCVRTHIHHWLSFVCTYTYPPLVVIRVYLVLHISTTGRHSCVPSPTHIHHWSSFVCI